MHCIHVVSDSLESLRQVNSEGGRCYREVARRVAREVGWATSDHVDVGAAELVASVHEGDVVIFASNSIRHPESPLFREVVKDTEARTSLHSALSRCHVLMSHQYSPAWTLLLDDPPPTRRKLLSHASAANLWIARHPLTVAPHLWARVDLNRKLPRDDNLSWWALESGDDGNWDSLVRDAEGSSSARIVIRTHEDFRQVVTSLPLDWMDARHCIGSIVRWLAVGPVHIGRVSNVDEPTPLGISPWGPPERLLSAFGVEGFGTELEPELQPDVVLAGPSHMVLHPDLADSGPWQRVTEVAPGLGVTVWVPTRTGPNVEIVAREPSLQGRLAMILCSRVVAQMDEFKQLMASPHENIYPARNVLVALALLRENPLGAGFIQKLLRDDALPTRLEYVGMTASSRLAALVASAALARLRRPEGSIPTTDLSYFASPTPATEASQWARDELDTFRLMDAARTIEALGGDVRGAPQSLDAARTSTAPRPAAERTSIETLGAMMRIHGNSEGPDRELASALLVDPSPMMLSEAATLTSGLLVSASSDAPFAGSSLQFVTRPVVIDTSRFDSDVVRRLRNFEESHRIIQMGRVAAWLLALLAVLGTLMALRGAFDRDDPAKLLLAVLIVAFVSLLALRALTWLRQLPAWGRVVQDLLDRFIRSAPGP